jgi:hypothetical protein
VTLAVFQGRREEAARRLLDATPLMNELSDASGLPQVDEGMLEKIREQYDLA